MHRTERRSSGCQTDNSDDIKPFDNIDQEISILSHIGIFENGKEVNEQQNFSLVYNGRDKMTGANYGMNWLIHDPYTDNLENIDEEPIINLG